MAQLRRRSVTNPDKAPYQALVGFQRIVYSPIGDQELGREDLTSTIRFTFADKVERGMMQYNPPLVGAGPHMMQYNRLGLTVIDSTPIRRSLPKLEDYLCH